MSLVSEASKDIYKEMKQEFKNSPWTVASIVCLWLVAWSVYIFVYPELARSAEVKPINDKVSTIEVKMLDREILAVLSQRCQASQKKFLTDRLHDLLLEYEDKAGRQYPPQPTCEDLH